MNAFRNLLALASITLLCSCGDDIEYRMNPNPVQDCIVRYGFTGTMSGDATAPAYQGTADATFSLVSNTCQGVHILQSNAPLQFVRGEPPTGFRNSLNGETFTGTTWEMTGGMEFRSAASKNENDCQVLAEMVGMISGGKISGTLAFRLGHPQSTAACQTLL